MLLIRTRAQLACTRQPHRVVLCQHRLARHLSSTLLTNDEELTLDDWIQRSLNNDTSLQYYDFISPSKLADLFYTLPTRERSYDQYFNLREYDKTWHPLQTLVHFHPREHENQLGKDMTDKNLSPPLPFTRRMWAGGAFRFPLIHKGPAGLGLVMLEDAVALARIEKIDKKGFEKGTPMVFVHQSIEYAYRHSSTVLVREERVHVFLPRQLRADSRAVHKVPGLPKPHYTFSWTPTPTTLFRFSALTFNAHLIHLDRDYARSEGYPERLVHGPLTALMLIEVLLTKCYNGPFDDFQYRAWNPAFVGRRQHIRVAFSSKRDSATLWSEDDDGVVGMTGTVKLLEPARISTEFIKQKGASRSSTRLK